MPAILSSPVATTSFYARIHSALLAHPTAEVLAWPAGPAHAVERLTAAGLLGWVSAARECLLARKLRAGQHVLLANSGPEALPVALAALALGATVVFPQPGLGLWRYIRLARATGAKVIHVAGRPNVVQQGWARCFGIALLHFSTLPHTDKATEPTWRPVSEAGQQTPLVVYSGGSGNGRARPVLFTQAVLAAQCDVRAAAPARCPAWREASAFSPALLVRLALPSVGCTVLPTAPAVTPFGFDARLAVQHVFAESSEALSGSVRFFQRLLPVLATLPTKVRQRIKVVRVGGAPVPEALVQALRDGFPHADLYVAYSVTEALLIAVRHVTGEAADPRRGYCVGHVADGIEVNLKSIGVGISLPGGYLQPIGEVRVRGPQVAQPPGAAPDAWLATGDCGYLDAATGELWLTSRRGNSLPAGGYQHYQIEQAAQWAEGVERVAVKSWGAGFQVWVEGTDPALTQTVQNQILHVYPGLRGVLRVQLLPRLHVDDRSGGNIRYGELAEK